VNARDDLGVFDAETLHEAMRQMWEAAGRAEGRPWTALDIAAAECEAPELEAPDVDALEARYEDWLLDDFGGAA
jgi:hypothetical protein